MVLPDVISMKYGNSSTAQPSTPPMNTGLRPILSASKAQSGWVISAATLPSTPAHSMVGRATPNLLVA